MKDEENPLQRQKIENLMYPLSEPKNIINKQESIFGDVTKYQPSIMYPLKSKISSLNTKIDI